MDNPITDLKNLSEPLTKLIDVTSKGIGALYSPLGTVRQAKADAKAKIIHARADSEVMDIHTRTQSRLAHREEIRQENIERVISLAGRELPDEVSPEDVSNDWILQFFDYAQDVCDEDLQILWARILAGEVSTPGRYSKRTLQFLKTLDKIEAEKFSELCSFAFMYNGNTYCIFHSKVTEEAIRNKLGNDSWLNHFKSIGLVSAECSYPSPSDLSNLKVRYFDTSYIIEGPEKPSEGARKKRIELICGIEHFSMIGQQLAKIAGAKPEEGYVDQLSRSLHGEGLPLNFVPIEK